MSRCELRFERRGGATVLSHAYAEPPFHVGRTLALGDAAYVILVCTGPGVFAGDRLDQPVHVGPGARAVLTSQSALQVHPSASPDPARIDHVYRVDDGGELVCDWDLVIPFAGARVAQRFAIELS